MAGAEVEAEDRRTEDTVGSVMRPAPRGGMKDGPEMGSCEGTEGEEELQPETGRRGEAGEATGAEARAVGKGEEE